MPYCTTEDIINPLGLKPQHFRLDKEEDPDAALTALVEDWIEQADAMINSYCHTSFTETDTNAIKVVKSVSIRLVSNMAAFAQARRDTPLIKVNDWKVQLNSFTIFTQDLKDDLAPYVVDNPSTEEIIIASTFING
jgi:hypothetical protein